MITFKKRPHINRFCPCWDTQKLNWDNIATRFRSLYYRGRVNGKSTKNLEIYYDIWKAAENNAEYERLITQSTCSI